MKFDWTILHMIQDIFQCGLMDWLMPKITILGDAGFIWIAIGIAFLVHKKYRKTGIFVLAGLLLGLIIGNGIVKNVVARPRPCWLDPDFHLLIPSPKDYSFPSGHTQASVIAATIITRFHKKMGWIVVPLAIVIAFSRLYLYVHFPTDVMGGAVLGFTIGIFTYYVGNKIINKIQTKGRCR